METLQQKALIATIITFYFVIHCNGVKVTLTIPETKDIYVSYGETLMIECKLNSTTFDPNESRSWVANGVTLINDGSYLSAGSGYNETSGTSGFSLSTPTLDYSFDGTKYQCNYGFDQAAVDVKITDIGSTTQSSGDCIDGKSIDKCWFSLSKVIPEISPPNLTISYEDDTVGDITPMLNVTSRFNADGKTRAYDFKIESTSFSKFIKAITLSFKAGPISRTLIIITGLTTLSSTISSDMSTTVLEPSSTIGSDMPTTVSEFSSTIGSDMPTTVSEPSSTIGSDMPSTVSEVSPPPVTTSSSGLSQEIVITITIISSILAVGVLILLIVLVVKQCRQKNRENPSKKKENLFATKQGNFTKKDASKSSIKPRKSKFSGKRNTKQESISLDKFEHTQFNNSQGPKERMYEHYPQTTDYMYWHNSGNQHDFNHSHAERNMFKYQHDRYPKSRSGPNNRIGYQSNYPEHPGHNEGMFQYYRADKLYRGQQMYQGPYVAQYDHHNKNKPENKRRYEGRTYERNWDFLY